MFVLAVPAFAVHTTTSPTDDHVIRTFKAKFPRSMFFPNYQTVVGALRYGNSHMTYTGTHSQQVTYYPYSAYVQGFSGVEYLVPGMVSDGQVVPLFPDDWDIPSSSYVWRYMSLGAGSNSANDLGNGSYSMPFACLLDVNDSASLMYYLQDSNYQNASISLHNTSFLVNESAEARFAVMSKGSDRPSQFFTASGNGNERVVIVKDNEYSSSGSEDYYENPDFIGSYPFNGVSFGLFTLDDSGLYPVSFTKLGTFTGLIQSSDGISLDLPANVDGVPLSAFLDRKDSGSNIVRFGFFYYCTNWFYGDYTSIPYNMYTVVDDTGAKWTEKTEAVNKFLLPCFPASLYDYREDSSVDDSLNFVVTMNFAEEPEDPEPPVTNPPEEPSGGGNYNISSSAPAVTITPVTIRDPAPGVVSSLVDMLGSEVGAVYSVVGFSLFVPSMPWVLAAILLVVCIWCLFRLGGAILGRR